MSLINDIYDTADAIAKQREAKNKRAKAKLAAKKAAEK